VAIRSYKYLIRPNGAQQAALDEMLGAFCDLYNAGLQQRIEAYRRQGKSLSYADQANELKAVRLADDRLVKYGFSTEQQVLRRLDKSFKAFFRRVKTTKKAGYPRFRSKSRYDSADFRVGDGLTIRKSGKIGIVGIPGEIKVKWHRELPTKPVAAVLSRSAGRWYICFQLERPEAEVAERAVNPVGIDVGLTSLVALSNGETVPTPQITKTAAKGLRRRQRALARCKRFSKGWKRAKKVVARYQSKIANRRRDSLHKLSNRLADEFTHIAFEDLNIKGLASGMLAKSVHNAAWNQLIFMTTYKAEYAGGIVELVDPRRTSQECSECGTIVKKTLATRTHHCPECGLVLDRDVNAALNILHRGFPNFQGPGAGLVASSQRVAA
jgi:putative transposase